MIGTAQRPTTSVAQDNDSTMDHALPSVKPHLEPTPSLSVTFYEPTSRKIPAVTNLSQATSQETSGQSSGQERNKGLIPIERIPQ